MIDSYTSITLPNGIMRLTFWNSENGEGYTIEGNFCVTNNTEIQDPETEMIINCSDNSLKPITTQIFDDDGSKQDFTYKQLRELQNDIR